MQYVFVQIFQDVKSKQQYKPRILILSVQYQLFPYYVKALLLELHTYTSQMS